MAFITLFVFPKQENPQY